MKKNMPTVIIEVKKGSMYIVLLTNCCEKLCETQILHTKYSLN